MRPVHAWHQLCTFLVQCAFRPWWVHDQIIVRMMVDAQMSRAQSNSIHLCDPGPFHWSVFWQLLQSSVWVVKILNQLNKLVAGHADA